MGLTHNGTPYVFLYHPESLKALSLEDNVYHTLKDFFMNANNADDALDITKFNLQLTNNIYFEDRTKDFTYASVLKNKLFVEHLLRWLNASMPPNFYFTDTLDEEDEIIKADKIQLHVKYNNKISVYMTFEAWLENYTNLKNILLPQRLLDCTANCT